MKKIAIVAILFVLAVTIIIILWKTANEPNSHDNGFTRHFIQGGMTKEKEFDVAANVKYIAGIVNGKIYFSTLKPGELLWRNLNNGKKYRKQFITNTFLLKRLNKSNTLSVDNRNIILFDGSARVVVIAGLNDKKERVYRTGETFTNAVALADGTVILRKFKPGLKDQRLYRFDLESNKISGGSMVTEARNDGGLVTGGMLAFDSIARMGTYVSRYSNRIALVDENLKLVKQARTIDTFSRYTLESRKVISGKNYSMTNDNASRFVNKSTEMAGNILYVYSLVRADNETLQDFNDRNIVDLYRLPALNYIGSLIVPASDKQRIRNFKIQNDQFFVLYSQRLAVYKLPILSGNLQQTAYNKKLNL